METGKSVVGIDLSKRTLEAARIVSEKIERVSTKTNEGGLRILEGWVKPGDLIVLEAGSQAFRIARRLKKNVGCDVIVLNPGDVATIYQSLKKTDKEDALKLARLAIRNPRKELPEVEIPTEEQEAIRRLSTEQAHWSEQIRMNKNRLHSVYVEAGLTEITQKSLYDERNRNKSFELLPEAHQAEALRLMHQISSLEQTLCDIDDEIRARLKQNIDYASLIMSMPGIGPIMALAVLGYIGEGKRFSEAKQVSYFIGLVPKVQISGDMVHYGHIVKRGCLPIRRVIIQAAWALVRSREGGALREFYERLYPRIGKKKAIVATARKMAEVLYTMIRNGEYYRSSTSETVQKKMKLYGLAA